MVIMSLTTIIFSGAKAALDLARKAVSNAIAAKGKDHKVAFAGTAYALPVIYAATGNKLQI